jgi:putative transposase
MYNRNVIRQQAFKYELMPKGEQERDMRRFAGASRFVFNKALALQKARREQGDKKLNYAGLCKLLTEWRNDPETLWLSEAPVHPLQQALKDLERAYTNFFAKRTDFPRFKKRGQSSSFRFPDPKQMKLDQGNDRIFLPKLGWVRYRNSREIMGDLCNITISQCGGKWFASIQTQRKVEQAPSTASTAIGIDVGIARFATMSDGSFVAPLNSFKNHQLRLARYQRRMARKVKFSNNWKKITAKVTKIHIDIANATPEKTSYTRPRQRSAKTTRLFVSKTCRYGTCPDRQPEQWKNRGRMFAPSPASIVPSSIKGGASSAGN